MFVFFCFVFVVGGGGYLVGEVACGDWGDGLAADEDCVKLKACRNVQLDPSAPVLNLKPV
jgi:hypothetical protein